MSLVSNSDLWAKLIATGITSVVMYYLLRMLLKQMEPNYDKKEKAQAVAQNLIKRLKRNGVSLNEYESLIAADVVDPEDIAEGFEDVGGLEQTLQLLKEEIVLPFKQPELYETGSRLLQPPKGLLLFGPPGCGKTLIARTLAKECGCCFINVKPSSFMDKWYGESQKLVEAIFSLAEKLQPSIIFVDEMDAFLRMRTSNDYEASSVVKAQFMTLWDGFATNPKSKVVVVGATNRPQDVDRAILRRLPRTCRLGLPDDKQRCKILQVILRHEKLAADVDIADLARRTHGYSGSDLHELCRVAATTAARESLRAGVVVELQMRHLEGARTSVETSVTEGIFEV